MGRLAGGQNDLRAAQCEVIEAEARKVASRRHCRSRERRRFGAASGGLQSLRFSQRMRRLEANNEAERSFRREGSAWRVQRRLDAVTASADCAAGNQCRRGCPASSNVDLAEHGATASTVPTSMI